MKNISFAGIERLRYSKCVSEYYTLIKCKIGEIIVADSPWY